MNQEEKPSKLDFISNDPGASKFGNFINYYSFHNVEERTSNLHPDMLPNTTSNDILCLDIGCNTGNLTKEVYIYLTSKYDKNIHILGVDIDPILIQRAEESNNKPNIKYLSVNIMESEGPEQIKSYLLSHNRQNFDMTFCFSVTMWIHINNGDDGLLTFLDYIKSISRAIIIEPQPWKCYRNAQRRLKKAGNTFEHYETLKIRSNVHEFIEANIIRDNIFRKVYESPNSSWDRRIQCYHLNESNIHNK